MRRAIVWPLFPLVPLYATGVRWKNAAYNYGMIRPQLLGWPVVSVGNLSMGGTGKTPLVMLLARQLAERGWYADVLSRGYGRAGRTVARVNPSGEAVEYGDEPLLMARRGLPVFVATQRYLAGRLAEEVGEHSLPQRRIHLLDDGFQHRQLARAVDIVLLRRDDLEDEMLPAGRLREPLRSLERADICVLCAEDADLIGRVQSYMRQPDPSRVWLMERAITLPARAGRNPLAFCAVGDPHSFFQSLRRVGMHPAAEIAFRDHHLYAPSDMELLMKRARSTGADGWITTEKDLARLSPELRAELEREFPLAVAELQVSLRAADRAMALLEELLGLRFQQSKLSVR